MFPLGEAHLERVFLTVLALLHLTAASTDTLATTAVSNVSISALTSNYSVEVVHPYRPCGSDYKYYCGNGGQCIFPQDTDKPSCICTSSFKGERCLLFYIDHSHSLPELEELLAISLGVAMFILILAIITCCIVRRRCVKSAPLLKMATESSV